MGSDRPVSAAEGRGVEKPAAEPRGTLSLFQRLLSQPAARWKSGAAAVAAIVAAAIGVMNQIESCGVARIEDAQRQVREAGEVPPDERAMLPLRTAVERLHDSGASLPNDLRNFQLSGARLEGVNLAGAHASGVRFGEAHLVSANFSDATIRRSDFRRANLGGADFSRADIHGSDFQEAEFRSRGAGPATLPFGMACADFSGVDLSRLDVSERIFIFGSVAGARFEGADLRGTSFMYTDVTGADFSAATGIGEAFQLADACVQGARLPSLPDGVAWAGKNCNQFELQRRQECPAR